VISYEVIKLNPLTVREIVSGEGQLLGDMFMKSALVALIKSRVHEVYGSLTDVDLAALDEQIEKLWHRTRTILGSTMMRPVWSHRVKIEYLDGSLGTPVVVSG
jgi:hypothetical protein